MEFTPHLEDIHYEIRVYTVTLFSSIRFAWDVGVCYCRLCAELPDTSKSSCSSWCQQPKGFAGVGDGQCEIPDFCLERNEEVQKAAPMVLGEPGPCHGGGDAIHDG